MNTSDIEKLQLAPKKPQLSLLDNDCRLTRINEVEGNEVNPTPFIHSIKPLEELSLCDVGETPPESYQIAHLPSRPATAGVGALTKHLERVSTIASGCAPFKESLSISPLHVSRKTSDVNIDDTVRRSPRSRSDNNIAAAYTLSPIIIQTSYLTNENSTELFHPMEGQRPMTSLGVNIKDRGFSASVDDLHDTNFCITLKNPHKDDLNNLAETTTSSMNAQKKQFIFRAVSESTEDGHASDAEAAAIKRLAKQTPFFGGVRSQCNYCCAMGETAAQLPIHTLRGRCTCHESICSCHKQHALSVVNLPSLRKSRRTPGLDEISYDFMRASGAISGFSQLRSVKGIKHDREKQEMCSAFPPAIVANLDTRGAVALLAASTRPRLIANMRKKTNKAHSSQEEVPTSLKPITWASSFDSSCNIHSQDDDYSRSGPPKWEESACVPMTGKQPALINRNSNYGGSIAQETLLGIKNCKLSGTGDTEEFINLNSSSINSVEQETGEDQEDDTLIASTDMARPKRPYYCQKAQKFRNSWRTQSVENPQSTIEGKLVRDRSLTMVESQSGSDTKSTNGGNTDRGAQVTVYLTRGSRNPVKTILVNHNAANIAAANAARLRARRQKTFSNCNQWRSVQLSPTHDVETDKQGWLGDDELYNTSLCNIHESYPNNLCLHRTPCTCTNKSQLSWRKRSPSPYLTSVASSMDVAKIKQLTKSSEVVPTSILKPQVSHRTSERKSSDDDGPCLEPMFALRQRRMRAMARHQSNSTFHNVGYRLGRRRRMFQHRSVVSDYSLAFAVLGILLMIVENELTSGQVVTKDSIWSLMLKSLITCSTLALIGLIVLYHIIVVRILSFDDCIEDWQIAWDRSRVAKLVIEILVCAIHPVPGNFTFSWPSSYYLFGSNILLSCAHCKNGTLDPSLLTSGASVPRVSAISGSPHVIFPSNKVVSIDIILSLPMFLRLYLIFRVVVLHSKLFTDTGSRSIGAMNKVDFTTQFVFKTFMTICPGTVLVAFILGFWAVLAWMLRACERVQDPVFGNLFNSMWLVAVTFLSIGYGDVVANTYCGRAISIVAGVLGSLCTALVVAVFAKRLELSRAEKHVIHFMMESTLTKQMKYYAANVLRETWLIYKYTKLVKKLNASTIRKHQRKFLRAIHGLRHVKLEQRKLQDNANTLIDLAKTQSIINDTVSEMRIQHTRLQIRLEAIEESLVRIQEQFTTLPIILKYIRMQTRNSSCSNQKSEDRMDLEECCTNQGTTNPYMRYRQTSSRIFNHQGSRATTIRCDDSDLVIHNSAAQLLTNDRLEAAAQSAVSFESTQSHKPPSYARDCLDVEPVQRAISEPLTSFLAAVR
ncbi:Small conductance calcium-activated potassium channel protein [Echinococcus granulosus]|uniref:Small conductance calcium activated potassium n=1 Tax=Echinococcus granulosus TaxID=6210 RepID=A0A068WCQ4_ECHGR|nr:Small conductance calcium-activated potassium channel protein [Echinococcus granulosus]CDS17520.1 small conductance calcium activated potassium [Echinococcus granulosus]